MIKDYTISELIDIASNYRTYDSESHKIIAVLDDQRQMRTIESFLGLTEILKTDSATVFEETGFSEQMEFVWNKKELYGIIGKVF